MILIVDDKQENIFSLKKILELNAFEVDTALSGEEALKKILKNDYYLIILDVQMPGMDGFEVAEAISGLNKTRNLPILFLSAVNTHKKFVTKGFESGGIDYLTKPFDPDILLLKVKNFYRLYQQSRQLAEAHAKLQDEVEIRKKTEKSLLETVEQLHSTLESIPQIAFTAKPEGSIEFVNQHWYHYATDNRTFPDTPPGQKAVMDIWQECIPTQRPCTSEVQIKQKGSDMYNYFLLRIIPVFVQQKLIKWVGTFTNIHEQKLLNEFLEEKVAERTHELVEANKHLEVSNNDLLQFASVASHDLKEPLRKIMIFSNLINEKYEADEGLKNHLNKIHQSSRRMDMLIEDILSFSKLSTPATFEYSDLNPVLKEVLADLELTIAEKQATIKYAQLPCIDMLPGLMRQLFQNLLTNALKFVEQGIKPNIEICSELTNELSYESPSVIS
jgi:CheY-like chemotaxis protein